MTVTAHENSGCSLNTIIATQDLDRRRSKLRAAGADEAAVFLQLTRDLAKDPESFFQKLVEAALLLSGAQSSGISLLNESAGRFVWPAVAGGLSPYLREGTPSDFGPCGTVMDQGRSLLMLHPERYFSYLTPITPALEEVLLIPFRVEGKIVGTIWAVVHESGQQFDAEDKRILEELSAFAAASYKTLLDFGLLEPFLAVKRN